METIENENPWIPFQEVDFYDESIIQFHVDTRDFHCKTNKVDLTNLGDKINWEKISKYPDRFYFNTEEVLFLLNRLYQDSGGEKEWRMLVLDTPKWNFWEFKYIRIYRIVNNIFLICNKDSYAYKKEILDTVVVVEWLQGTPNPEPSE